MAGDDEQLEGDDAIEETEIDTTVVVATSEDGVTAVGVSSTYEIDVDGDGVPDVVETVDAVAIDVDGDGVPDIVVTTTTDAIDVDGDGIPDIVQQTTITAVDVDGDGSPDIVDVEETIIVADELSGDVDDDDDDDD